jgi:glycosyltransferase involved in cell wall biosynthesis
MNAVILYVKLAPFHFARLETAGRLWAERGAKLTCVETASDQENYSWGRSEYAPDSFNYLTLFDRDYFSLGYGEIRRALNRALDEARPDVVVINGWGHKESAAALGWCYRRRVPRVVVSDSQYIDAPRRRWKESLKRAFVSQCDAGFAGGAPHVRYLENLGLPARFCVTGCDVVDNETFRPPAGLPTESDAGPEALRILSCLRLLTIKNVPATLRALSRLELPWRWTLAGDGPEREVIERCVEELGLRDRVELLGHVPYRQLPELYGAADVYLQPSVSEPWGLAVNEAMSAGLPVLVSDRCGCHEDLVREGRNGYTFDPRSTKSLAAAVEKLWGRRGEWARMGEASREIIRNWSLDFFARNLWRACELALTRRQEAEAGGSMLSRLLCGVL